MRTAYLCVHGIQGSPDQFDWIIRALPEGARVENLLLPGHGSDVRAFSRSTMHQWQACVDSALDRLRDECDRIVYIGHSMGCLLGILACLKNPEKLASLILLACPLKIRITGRYIRQNFIAVSKRPSNDPFILAARAAHSVKAKHMLEYVLCVGPYLHLFRLIHAANRKLGGLKLPVLAVFSERDEIVSLRSKDVIAGVSGCEIHLAEGCGHLYYEASAREKIIERMKAYI